MFYVQEILHFLFFLSHTTVRCISPQTKWESLLDAIQHPCKIPHCPNLLAFSIRAVPAPCVTDEEETTEGEWRRFSFAEPNRNEGGSGVSSPGRPLIMTAVQVLFYPRTEGLEDAGVFCSDRKGRVPSGSHSMESCTLSVWPCCSNFLAIRRDRRHRAIASTRNAAACSTSRSPN